ncbi:STAS-like domain-containing protein [Candidatus Electronema sp. PJ]|uniref:STAS-like domain-containing protein n=1 Tax=Candidatus Electronema sp. PJ TaxID=3401572 RepID=UPI003AA8BCE0
MAGVRTRGENIRQFILTNVEEHPRDIAVVAADHFGITRQAVNNHIKRLIEQKSIAVEGNTCNRIYRLHPLVKKVESFILSGLEEDRVWMNFAMPILGVLPNNVTQILSYGFTEMLNNAIDHSQGHSVSISIEKYPLHSEILIFDDGIGIFKKIQEKFHLNDERQAVLELAKGKLTTAPEHHTGQGIFFSSRMFDRYAIFSGGVYFSHKWNKPEDWILECDPLERGTAVFMKIANNSSRNIKAIFDSFTSGDDYAFNKTIVPVSLALYGNESLVSRSQAKRLLVRIDRFNTVIFDFTGIDFIGQAFADEVFRVFKNQHPEIQLQAINTVPDVKAMIDRAGSSQ